MPETGIDEKCINCKYWNEDWCHKHAEEKLWFMTCRYFFSGVFVPWVEDAKT